MSLEQSTISTHEQRSRRKVKEYFSLILTVLILKYLFSSLFWQYMTLILYTHNDVKRLIIRCNFCVIEAWAPLSQIPLCTVYPLFIMPDNLFPVSIHFASLFTVTEGNSCFHRLFSCWAEVLLVSLQVMYKYKWEVTEYSTSPVP